MGTYLGQYCINVTDLKRSTDFYENVIGLEVTDRIDIPGVKEVVLAGEDGSKIQLAHHADHDLGLVDQRHGLGRDVQRGTFLIAQSLDGIVVHGDDFGGGQDIDGEPFSGVAGQFGANRPFLPHQCHAHTILAGGQNRAFHFTSRGVVTPHSIHGDGNHCG